MIKPFLARFEIEAILPGEPVGPAIAEGLHAHLCIGYMSGLLEDRMRAPKPKWRRTGGPAQLDGADARVDVPRALQQEQETTPE